MSNTKFILYRIKLESSEFPEILYVDNSRPELMNKLHKLIGNYFDKTYAKDASWAIEEGLYSPRQEYIDFIIDGFNWCDKVRDVNAFGDAYFVITPVNI